MIVSIYIFHSYLSLSVVCENNRVCIAYPDSVTSWISICFQESLGLNFFLIDIVEHMLKSQRCEYMGWLPRTSNHFQMCVL
jgi:hypothetical protein